MHLVMFDIDGTLLQSTSFDHACYLRAIREVLSLDIEDDWEGVEHISDSGILKHLCNVHKIENFEHIEARVKSLFLGYVSEYLNRTPCMATGGAARFVQYLRCCNDVKLAIATGGWRESAFMKLSSANMNVDGIAFASSSDHFARTEIMKIAQERSGRQEYESISYFGDGLWDHKASNALNYQFVLIGRAFESTPQFEDFEDVEAIAAEIGITAG